MPRPDFPKNIREFQALFTDEESCAEYLFESRWPEGFQCPKCGHGEYYEVEDYDRFECANCGHQTSLTAGTVMHKTRLPLSTWFYGAFLMTTLKPGISALQFQGQLGLHNYETAYQMLQKLRAGLVNPERSKLFGEVQVDETYVGGPEAGRHGRGARGKAIVAGAVEVRGRASGRLRLRVIPDVTAKTLGKFISDNIEEDSTVITDAMPSYSILSKMGYSHIVRVERDPERGHKILPQIHRAFGNLKAELVGTYHGVDPKHLQAYLNEFVFRFNRRITPMAAFQTALGIGSHIQAPTYEDIYTAGEPGAWTHVGRPK
ncbi:MAG: IS1595 family transposase [bacterium]